MDAEFSLQAIAPPVHQDKRALQDAGQGAGVEGVIRPSRIAAELFVLGFDPALRRSNAPAQVCELSGKIGHGGSNPYADT
jgi:hypothetical protein